MQVFLGRVPFENIVKENEKGDSPAHGPLGRRLYFEPAAPVITLGRRHHSEDELKKFQLLSGGIPVIFADRGGHETFHGPGQLVLFWESELRQICPPPQGISDWVCVGLRAIRSLCVQVGVPEKELKLESGERLGVWWRNQKLAQIGIRVRDGRVRHGFSLNVRREAQSFYGIHPCGLADASPGYLEEAASAVESPHAVSSMSNVAGMQELALRWDGALLQEVRSHRGSQCP